MSKPKPAIKVAPNKKTGRPSSFTQETADTICQLIGDGHSLRTICQSEHMPDKATVFRWLDVNEPFRDQYARARDIQAATYADDIVDIADTEEDPQKARVRIDARKWHASKLAPKKYGDKLELAGDRDNPLMVVHEAGKSIDAKLERIIAGRTEKAEG